jgi:hypothetical protein
MERWRGRFSAGSEAIPFQAGSAKNGAGVILLRARRMSRVIVIEMMKDNCLHLRLGGHLPDLLLVQMMEGKVFHHYSGH